MLAAKETHMRLPGLSGLRVVITAAGSGIGLCIARVLADQGARLAICDIDQKRLDAAAATTGAEVTEIADVSDEADVSRLFSRVSDRMGELDALVNNAGIAGPTGGVETIDPSAWRRCIDVCLTGTVSMHASCGSYAEGRWWRGYRQHIFGCRSLWLCL